MQDRKLDDPRFTYGDYVQWQGDERWELIDGRAFLISPAPSRRHQEVLGELYRQMARQLEGRLCEVYIAPFDVRLPTGNEVDADVDTVVQPDLSVFCDPDKLSVTRTSCLCPGQAGRRGCPGSAGLGDRDPLASDHGTRPSRETRAL